MGKLTDDMSKLVGEIHALHESRQRSLQDMRAAVSTMRRAFGDQMRKVAEDIAGARQAWAGVMSGRVSAGSSMGTMGGRRGRGRSFMGGESA